MAFNGVCGVEAERANRVNVLCLGSQLAGHNNNIDVC